ncbi:MAG: hypothetical protein ABIE70_00620 [bacterium]
MKFRLCLIGMTLVLLLSGCVSYYTKVYTLEEPPEDLFADLKVIEGFQGWDVYVGVTCAYRNSHTEEVELDSFGVSITAAAALKAMLSEDSLWIDSVYVTLNDGRAVTALKERNRRMSVRSSSIYTLYKRIQIPETNDSVGIGFTVHLIKASGEEYRKRWEGTLYRYEKKVKWLPLD